MDAIHLRTRIQRRGDELVIPIPRHLEPRHAQAGDEVVVPLRATHREAPRPPGARPDGRRRRGRHRSRGKRTRASDPSPPSILRPS